MFLDNIQFLEFNKGLSPSKYKNHNQMQGQQDICSYLKQNLQLKNRNLLLEQIKQTITPQQTPQQVPIILQQYTESYQHFMHKHKLMSNTKSNGLIDEILNNVHPGLKTKKQCKVILSIIARILCQQLIQQCVQIVDQKGKNENAKTNGKDEGKSLIINGGNHEMRKSQKCSQVINIDVIEEAYRRRLIKKQKL